jgi:hypothetical protein
MRKSVELASPADELRIAGSLRWLQIAAPFGLSLVVGTMLGAMAGAFSYTNAVDPTAGDGRYVVAQLTGIAIGFVIGIFWARHTALAPPPPDTVNLGMTMLRKYHRNTARSGADVDAAQYKIGAEFVRSLHNSS